MIDWEQPPNKNEVNFRSGFTHYANVFQVMTSCGEMTGFELRTSNFMQDVNCPCCLVKEGRWK